MAIYTHKILACFIHDMLSDKLPLINKIKDSKIKRYARRSAKTARRENTCTLKLFILLNMLIC